MNARIVPLNHFTATVDPYGFDMDVTYEFDEGEPPILWPDSLAHPGTPPTAAVLTCKVGGVDIIDMLSAKQIDRIEQCIVDQMEAA
jgi:hypothetical protein